MKNLIKKNIFKTLRIGIAGTGRVGTSLARFFSEKKCVPYVLVNRPGNPTRALIKDIRPAHSGKSYHLLSDCEFIVLAVPDPEIENAAKQISNIRFTSKNIYLVHTSGSCHSGFLNLAKDNPEAAIHIGSMHPMQTFIRKTIATKNIPLPDLQHTFFGLEGERRTIRFLESFMKYLDCRYIIIPSKDKLTYHIGGVFAANFLVAMFDSVIRIYRRMGADPESARAIIMPLIETTIQNCRRLSPSDALTGPASRNDLKTIEKHLQRLNELDPVIANAYYGLTEICFRMKGFGS